MYVRHKVIKGHIYYYLVRTERRGKKVRQTVIKYLGKHGWAGVAPNRFTTVVNKQAEATYVRMFRRLGCASVNFDIPFSDYGHFGRTENHLNTHEIHVRFRRPVSIQTMAHELGHVMDILMHEDAKGSSAVGSTDPEFLQHDAELRRIAEYSNTQRGTIRSPARLAKLEELQERHPENLTIYNEIERFHAHYSLYAYQYYELFARLISICLTEPRKATQLAPRATEWLMDALYEHPRIRKILTEFDCWELGTTSPDDPVDQTPTAR